MDGERFDRIITALPSVSSRRRAVGGLFGGFLSAALGLAAMEAGNKGKKGKDANSAPNLRHPFEGRWSTTVNGTTPGYAKFYYTTEMFVTSLIGDYCNTTGCGVIRPCEGPEPALSCDWSQNDGTTGSFTIFLSPDGAHFEGTYSRDPQPGVPAIGGPYEGDFKKRV